VSDTNEDKVRKVELLISNLLRVGVIVSLLIVTIGTIFSFAHHHDYLNVSKELPALTRPGAVFPHTIKSVIADLLKLRGRAIVMTGLLLLIATPVARVAVSIFAFIYQKDRVFVLVTTTVLILLLLSFFLGKAGG
jgi:uncharacterized membrane protein